jgi:hypothetical protein
MIMTQTEARLRAKKLGGIAVSARPGAGGIWHLGGWSAPGDVWIVVDLKKTRVLDDREVVSS